MFYHDQNQLTKGKITKWFNDHDIPGKKYKILLPVFTQYWIDTKIPTIAAHWLACSLTAQNMLPEVLSEVWMSGLNAKMLKNAKCSLVAQHWVKTARFFFNLSTCHQTCCTCKHQTCSGASLSLSFREQRVLPDGLSSGTKSPGTQSSAHSRVFVNLPALESLNHQLVVFYILFFSFFFSPRTWRSGKQISQQQE